MNETKQEIFKMLTESTGIHMLDSGQKNNRAWQKNRARVELFGEDVFENEREQWVNGNWDYIEFTKSTYHFLVEHLEYNDHLTELFTQFSEQSNSYYLEDIRNWLDSLGDRVEGGIYGEGEPLSFNTYNGEECLTQTLQGTIFALDSWVYIILQIHGGCDVRGGYTRPRVFNFKDTEDYFLMGLSGGDISCNNSNCFENWYSDDLYNWYQNGGSNGINLKDLELIEDSNKVNATLQAFDYKVWNKEPKNLHVLEDGSIICPVCGLGILE